jgi:hypothetical protein
MSAAGGSPITRVILGACALWAVACLGLAAWGVVQNPMRARRAALDERLAKITYVPEDIATPDRSPMKLQRKSIVDKDALWRPLVAPPAAPPPPEEKPDLLQKLQTVTVSARDQIRTGDSLKVKLHMSPEDKRGRWISVGDKINGLTVLEIRDDAVVFALEQNGKQYTEELPRR